ncbi:MULTISPECIES: cysteine hydrolase [unclassified Mesorhizobium]|uniref:cysteine hydrolase family protein n=1 Tax=unclassified Mesorhizobium TaxID=325217 RepID=UPI000FCC3142|nr:MULTISPECIES: cysteine hydrolase [unclassified Mesorhizobium]RUW70107.1 isochorismatase family protein [Mesorhizobium sp. M4B.F.Ca.ET.049.02.1.2]RVD23446.1 isochorismatase family protein [Mesorhizobium sp. M4B.F.Ca.ET.017.02.2.1]TGV26118.1 isochorismatase family protein [Mesorhizobium sp. M4B.F.Ca.ET.143.01.1.1]
MLALDAKPEPVCIMPAQTAIIVVDMQNAFASAGGMFDLAGFDISGAAPAIEANKRLLAAARKAGLTVVYLQMSYRPDLGDAGDASSPNYHKELGMVLMRQRPELCGKLLIDNSWDWQIVDALKPEPGDQIIRKSRYSGFCNTGLEAYLRARNIRHLLFSGVATNVCVDATARDAYMLEFWPVLVEDAMNHSGPDFNRQATLWNFENAFGWVTRTDIVVEALRAKAAQPLPA